VHRRLADADPGHRRRATCERPLTAASTRSIPGRLAHRRRARRSDRVFRHARRRNRGPPA
jgi:hypothetical protein